jgi:hypothetical protein
VDGTGAGKALEEVLRKLPNATVRNANFPPIPGVHALIVVGLTPPP